MSVCLYDISLSIFLSITNRNCGAGCSDCGGDGGGTGSSLNFLGVQFWCDLECAGGGDGGGVAENGGDVTPVVFERLWFCSVGMVVMW